jgi:glycosyltransferase involved in cell wall biosynthesis
MPQVTVIVPAYNEAPRATRCIAALRNQTYPRELLQIIVVDNGSEDGTFELLQGIDGITALRETRPGSYLARNLGLAHATGEVVFFTDADCVADQAWVEKALVHFRGANVGIVAGAVELFSENPVAPTAGELFESCFAFKQADNVKGSFCVTANWASPRRVLDQVGHFDGRLKSGGDAELSARIANAGYRFEFAPDAVVRHPARATIQGLMAKKRRVVGGKYVLECEVRRKGFLVLIWQLVREVLGRLRTVFFRSPFRGRQRLKIAGVAILLFGVALA